MLNGIEREEIIQVILLISFIILLFGIPIYCLITGIIPSEEEYYRKKGLEKAIVIEDAKGSKRIYIKNNNELVDAIKKEILEKEVAK